MRIDQADDDDGRPEATDVPAPPARHLPGPGRPDYPDATPLSRALEYRATVDAVNRACAIDQGYARVREIERGAVTPAMLRVEAEDPDRHLAGLEHRLKGEERVEEKVAHDMEKRGVTAEEAFAAVKDVIRYTFCYPDDRYAAGVRADCDRLKGEGFGLSDFRNTWEHEEYKGMNSRWRIPGTSQMFEVQFHTRASLEAKEKTHGAYERLRTLPPGHEEVRDLHAYQRAVTAKIPIPPDAMDVSIS